MNMHSHRHTHTHSSGHTCNDTVRTVERGVGRRAKVGGGFGSGGVESFEMARGLGKDVERERGKGGISSAPLCDWKFNGERERERGRGVGESGGGEGGREEEKAKGTETSLLCGFQLKLAVVNNAHYGIHREGEGGEESRSKGEGMKEKYREGGGGESIYVRGTSEVIAGLVLSSGRQGELRLQLKFV